VPPSARPSCAPHPTIDPGSNSVADLHGRHAPRLVPAHPNMPRGVSLVLLARGIEQPLKHSTVFLFYLLTQ